MFSALQSAFGTWPNEKSFHPGNNAQSSGSDFGVNETFAIGGEHGNEADDGLNRSDEHQMISRRLPYELRPNMTTQGRPVIPPFFVPPGAASTGVLQEHWRTAEHRKPHHPSSPSVNEDLAVKHASGPPLSARSLAHGAVADDEDMSEDSSGHSASPPLLDDGFEQERQKLWSNDDRKAFHEMVTAEGYVNRYRMHMKKYQRMVHCLEHPDLDPTLCDGTKDHQTKYQAANWTLIDGRLYRKPEAGRVGSLRRHLDETETWDVLTREHLTSGHLGRDKLRKRLEQKYIGYTLQEIMFVLKECKRCNGGIKSHDASISTTMDQDQSQPAKSASEAKQDWSRPLFRQQTSNMMFP